MKKEYLLRSRMMRYLSHQAKIERVGYVLKAIMKKKSSKSNNGDPVKAFAV
tara:strand:+ start:334 stop:486 length:153 start_codon:yes stop_codon:yes gene_type:complete